MALFTMPSETSDIDLFSLLFTEEQDTPFHFSISFSVAELITETEWLNDLSYSKDSHASVEKSIDRNCMSFSTKIVPVIQWVFAAMRRVDCT